VVAERENAPALIYIDLHLVHEVTSPQAFDGLRRRGLKVRRPDLTIATTDHSTPTTPKGFPILDKIAATQVERLEQNCRDFGIECYGLSSDRQGIVHVIGPELGLTQPGKTVVCGDSHTATHGAFGALAFGIGTSEVEHVLASQCLLQRPSKTFAVRVDGTLSAGVTAKDIILALLSRIGIGGGNGLRDRIPRIGDSCASMEERMTVCNMSIEGGARAGLIVRTILLSNTWPGGRSAEGRRLGCCRGRLAKAADRRRRDLRSRNHHRRELARAHDHLRNQSGDGHRDFGSRARSSRYFRPMEEKRSSKLCATWICPRVNR